jgi:hypothetical protein
MDHFVKLERLPDGYEIPRELRDKFQFDAEAHKLVFRGYMSKTEFDRICEPTRDWGFRRLVEELFRMSVVDTGADADAPKPSRGLFAKLFVRN